MTPNNFQWFLTSAIDYTSTRTFGFYKEYSDALSAVLTNRCNMHEGLYEYLIMEKMKEGIHPLAEEENWFKWKNNKWVSCRKPSKFSGIINWALG